MESTTSANNKLIKTYYQDYSHRNANLMHDYFKHLLKKTFLAIPKVENEC